MSIDTRSPHLPESLSQKDLKIKCHNTLFRDPNDFHSNRMPQAERKICRFGPLRFFLQTRAPQYRSDYGKHFPTILFYENLSGCRKQPVRKLFFGAAYKIRKDLVLGIQTLVKCRSRHGWIFETSFAFAGSENNS